MAKAKKTKAVVVQTSAIQNLWNDQTFRSKMVETGRKTMTKIWNRRGFRKSVVEGMKSRWADPAFKAMMVKRMREAREAKAARA